MAKGKLNELELKVRIEAMADMLDDDPGNIGCETLEITMAALVLLYKGGMEPLDLLERCQYPDWRRILIGALAEAHREDGWFEEFVMAVCTAPSDFYEADDVQTLFETLDSMDELVRTVKASKDVGHPLAYALDVEKFWTLRATKYFARKDWKRSWDEIDHGRRGIKVSDNPCTENWGRASRELLGRLVDELFEHMLAAGILGPIGPEDAYVTSYVRKMRYETRVSANGRRPVSGLASYVRPGWEFAKQYQAKKAEAGSMVLIFAPTGIKVLRIAGHFRKEEDERRNTRRSRLHQEAVRQHEARKKR